MKAIGVSLFIGVFLAANGANATSVVETFSSRADYNAGAAAPNEAVWNQALQRVHPTLQVYNYEVPGPVSPIAWDSVAPSGNAVGNGSDGPFGPATFARFGTVVGGPIVAPGTVIIDTNVHPVLNVTSFYLPAGWTLQGTQASGQGPLVIKSLSTVDIEGTIDCTGGAGQAGSGVTPGAGGIGRCGGYAGGIGGAPNSSGSTGSAPAGITGGQGGNYVAPFVGGGGGAGWNNQAGLLPMGSSGGAGSSAPNGGQAGTPTADPLFSTIAGGAGGGGGSGDNLTDGGGGGGAGGGVVLIFSVSDITIGNSGYILANPGLGGSSPGSGGPGGGGGGGSILAFSGGNIIINNTDGAGASQANNAFGGSNASAGSGGQGGFGRSWFANNTGTGLTSGSGTYSPGEEPPVNNGGSPVEFISTAQSVITNAYDTGVHTDKATSLFVQPNSSDFQIEAEGSSDGVTYSAWSTDVTPIANMRYFKLKITITTSTPTAPTMVSSAGINFSGDTLTDFNFKTAGCGRVGSSSSGTSPLNSLFLLAPFLLACFLRWSMRAKRHG